MMCYFVFSCRLQVVVSDNLSLADVNCAVTMLMSILYEAAIPRYLLLFLFFIVTEMTDSMKVVLFQLEMDLFYQTQSHFCWTFNYSLPVPGTHLTANI